jgi:uncharacterized protein (TIGR00369 family)
MKANARTTPVIEPAIWREPFRGGFPDPRIIGLSGIEQIRTYFRGVVPRPPLHHLTGMLPTEAGHGTATFTMPASGWLLSPPGYVQLGTLAILADGPLGSAVQTALPPLTPYTTAELSMNYLRPVTAESGTLICRGRLILAGKSLGLSEAVVEDGTGRLVAHATSRCVVFPPLGPPPADPPELSPVGDPVHETPDPYLRPVAGAPLPQEVYDQMSGLEIMRGHIAGDLPAPPISHLTGLLPVEADEGTSTFVLPATGWLCSPLGKVEGGFIALLADSATACAVQSTVPARTSYAPLDLKVNFLRPVEPDGRDLVARGRIVHRGRTIAVASTEVTDADGKRVALATGTSMVLPDRPWHPERPLVPADEASDSDSDRPR